MTAPKAGFEKEQIDVRSSEVPAAKITISAQLLSEIIEHISEAYGRDLWEALDLYQQDDLVRQVVLAFRSSSRVTVLLRESEQDRSKAQQQLDVEAGIAIADTIRSLTPEAFRLVLKRLPTSSDILDR